MNYAQLRKEIEAEEGRRDRPYKDSLGLLTVGVGRCIDRVPFSDDEIDLMLDNDIRKAHEGVVKALPWIVNLNDARQRVLCQMAFQMGLAGLLGFKNTLAHAQAGEYDAAADGILASKLATQTPARAERLADMMRHG